MSECGPGCGCGLNCENRVTQRGVSVGLKIVRDEKKGWGLHAAQFIPKGQFVCEYAASPGHFSEWGYGILPLIFGNIHMSCCCVLVVRGISESM
ncbi:Histone-lysine N-methyltransferase SUVR3 [Vitis vinifera]|nr:Histone-lysine N-methyltransferase SUVR3 [Vitis vinifera]